MRFRPRPTADETLNTSPTYVVQPRFDELPPKAKSLLGPGERVNGSRGREDIRDEVPRVTQQNSRTLLGPPRLPEVPLPSAKIDMPTWSRSSSDILPTPLISPRIGVVPSRNGSSTAATSYQPRTEHQPSIESLSRNYYDAAKQPLYVSQQTSASAVRDMGLRKDRPPMNEMASDPLVTAKPLKSALKQTKSAPGSRGKDDQKKPKKLDLASLFPHPKASSGQLLSPAKYSQSPSAMTDAFEFFPQETVHAQVRRQGPNGRFEAHKATKQESLESPNMHSNRAKVFERDIYDNTKTHQRRPPKGIQNWFDGFDISSDEEEQEPVELPANPSRPSVGSMPSDFSPYISPNEVLPVPNASESTFSVNNVPRIVEPTRDIMRRRIKSRGSDISTVTASFSPAVHTRGNRRDAENTLAHVDSRLAHSRLETQSVLSLSSESEEEGGELTPVKDSYFFLDDEPIPGLRRPSIPPRKTNSSQAFKQDAMLRQSTSTAQTSGSIPIRLTEDLPEPSVTERSVNSRAADKVAMASPLNLQSPRESESKASRSRPSTRSGVSREDLRSAGGDTIESTPSDASRVMAVTEEEMMLLELMRKKRQAMQKSSFSEGYRLALKQEQDYLATRESAHHTAMGVVKEIKGEEKQEVALESNKSHNEGVRRDGKDRTKRYSALRKQDADSTFNMGRFLASEQAQEEPYVAKMARMERFLMMKPSLMDAIEEPRPVSGTEIEDYSLSEVEEEDFEMTEKTSSLEKAPSPLQRLTEMARHSSGTSSSEEQDIEEHHDKLRAFLASSPGSERASMGAFPSPPSNHPSDLEARLISPLSPTLSEQIPMPPLVPKRSPNRTPISQNSRGSNGGSTPRLPLSRSGGSDLLIDMEPTLPATSKWDEPHRMPSLDPTSLELANTRTRSSPSVNSSHPSPPTPTFAAIAPIAKGEARVVPVGGSSYSQTRAVPHRVETNVPQREPTQQSQAIPPSPRVFHSGNTARPSKRAPSKMNTAAKPDGRITSMTSITSAGEDVLAAWAELGGGKDALAYRRKDR